MLIFNMLIFHDYTVVLHNYTSACQAVLFQSNKYRHPVRNYSFTLAVTIVVHDTNIYISL